MNPKKDKHKENRTKRNHNQIAKQRVITRKYEMLHRKKDIPYMENKEENFHRLLIRNYEKQKTVE